MARRLCLDDAALGGYAIRRERAERCAYVREEVLCLVGGAGHQEHALHVVHKAVVFVRLCA